MEGWESESEREGWDLDVKYEQGSLDSVLASLPPAPPSFFSSFLHLYFLLLCVHVSVKLPPRCRQGALRLRNSPKVPPTPKVRAKPPTPLRSTWLREESIPAFWHLHATLPVSFSSDGEDAAQYSSPIGQQVSSVYHCRANLFPICSVPVETIHQVLISSKGFSLSTEGLPVRSYLTYSNTAFRHYLKKILLWLVQLNLNIIVLNYLFEAWMRRFAQTIYI